MHVDTCPVCRSAAGCECCLVCGGLWADCECVECQMCEVRTSDPDANVWRDGYCDACVAEVEDEERRAHAAAHPPEVA